MGLQIKSGSAAMKVKGVADVVFCFDCTGSMSSVIENVKTNVNKFVEGLNADQNIKIDWLMRAVGYGDLECGEEVQNGNKFVGDVAEFQSQVSNIKMVEGGNTPESTLDAIIYAAKTSKWRDRSQKVIVVFTDAPTKNVHSSTRTKFAINNVDELKKDLTENHIKLFLWGYTDDQYKALQVVPKSEITLMPDPHSTLVSADMVKVLEIMGKTISSEMKSDVL